MIEDPTARRSPARLSARRVPPAAIDFDRLGDLDDGIDDGIDDAFDDGSDVAAPTSVAGRGARGGPRAPRGGVGLLLRVVRPWFDPRPGELRGIIIVLAAGLVLTSALWFDASRRPSGPSASSGPGGTELQSFAPVTMLDAEGDWSGPVPPGAPAMSGTTEVVVHVSGAVAAPGLLVLAAGARVGDAILAAGGASPEAQLDRVNLARRLEDGEQVHVPRAGEDVAAPVATGSRGILADGRVDVNVATAEELATLPGIGPARAQAIIATREERPFAVPGDLRRVPGIGEATFQRLAPLVSVG
jgi:competence protein ComEA